MYSPFQTLSNTATCLVCSMSEGRRTDFTELLELLNVCDDIGEKVIYQGQVILTSDWLLPITILASHWSMITILTFLYQGQGQNGHGAAHSIGGGVTLTKVDRSNR